MLSTDPSRRPQHLQAASALARVPNDRIITQERIHQLYCISPHAPHSPYNIHQLVPDLRADIDVGNVRQVYEDGDVPLKVADIFVCLLRAQVQNLLCED